MADGDDGQVRGAGMCEYKTAADGSSTRQRLSVYRENCVSYLTTYEVVALAVALLTLKKNLAAASGDDAAHWHVARSTRRKLTVHLKFPTRRPSGRSSDTLLML